LDAIERALVPPESDVGVPTRWRRLRVSKQGDDDYACGLHCVVTAARHAGTIPRKAGPRRLLSTLEPRDAARIKARVRDAGLFEQDVRALAKAAGLAVYRPNTHEVEQFKEPG
jgi:hypothetical protein